jgi:prephenate dehydrogenase
MLVMDVGSTKRDVVDAARRALKEEVGSFVPCHPMTGKESSGVEHADADLYRGRQVIITPIERTLVAQLKKAQQAWEAVGGAVIKMAPDAHDAAIAAVSHLPHLLAFAYVNSIASQSGADDFLALAGPGFRDFSRIGASDPTMWRDILLANKAELLAQSRKFRESLTALEELVATGNGDALAAQIRQARSVREPWRMGGK